MKGQGGHRRHRWGASGGLHDARRQPNRGRFVREIGERRD